MAGGDSPQPVGDPTPRQCRGGHRGKNLARTGAPVEVRRPRNRPFGPRPSYAGGAAPQGKGRGRRPPAKEHPNAHPRRRRGLPGPFPRLLAVALPAAEQTHPAGNRPLLGRRRAASPAAGGGQAQGPRPPARLGGSGRRRPRVHAQPHALLPPDPALPRHPGLPGRPRAGQPVLREAGDAAAVQARRAPHRGEGGGGVCPMGGGGAEGKTWAEAPRALDCWSRVAVVRYRNRRAFLSLLADPAYGPLVPYKFMALELVLVPVSAGVVVPDLRLLV